MWQAFQHSNASPEELKLQGFDAVCFIRECHVHATWITARFLSVKPEVLMPKESGYLGGSYNPSQNGRLAYGRR